MIDWKQHNHWIYAWIPLFGGLVWFSTLWAMVIVWLAQGRPMYPTMTGRIAYISDIGATFLKPLFITGCSVTAGCFMMSLVAERWLRYRRQLVPTMRRRERALSSLAILGSVIGGVGLALLSIFDTNRATFTIAEICESFMSMSVLLKPLPKFHFISGDFKELRMLTWAYVAKGVIAGVLILLAVAFAISLFEAASAGAILEWIVAFGFTFYLLTFVWDVRMAKGVPAGELKPERLVAMREAGGGSIFERLRGKSASKDPVGHKANGHGASVDDGQPGVVPPQPV